MNNVYSATLKIIKRKDSLIFLILFLATLALIGWFSGNMNLASFSPEYIPMPPSSIVMFITLSILFLLHINLKKTQFTKSLILIFIIVDAVYCTIISLENIFGFKWDIEYILINNPASFGSVLTGRMSPISSLSFVLICSAILSVGKINSDKLRYIGGSLSIIVGIVSSMSLIGYLYKAPLLYGGGTIPVALPSAICFLLFSATFLRIFELRFWTFNLIKDNKITQRLLKSFIPIVILIVILQGFIESNFSINDKNPTLTSAIILVCFITITFLIIISLSTFLGDKFHRSEQALIESEKKLLQLNSDKDRFISILGHDLRSPFSALLGLTQELKENLHQLRIDEIETYVSYLNKSANNSYNLLEDILMWARTQYGQIAFKPEIIGLSIIFKEAIEVFQSNSNAKNIIINYNAPDNLKVLADIEMLKTILRNLVSNAIKFTNRNGVINITAIEHNKSVTISVTDNGIGIRADYLAKLFDISQILSTKGTEEETGTGIGLLLCKEFVEKHGCKIWVESELGKGSVFHFNLPSTFKNGKN